MVPTTALLNGDEGKQKVMVISADSVAHERPVTVGVRQGVGQILSGIQPGDQVVVSGGLGLEDKAKVTIQQPKSEDDDDDDAGGDDAKPDDAKGKDAEGKRNERAYSIVPAGALLPSIGPHAFQVPSSLSS